MRRLDSNWRRFTLNYMVKFSDAPLDRTFAALADPTRRALLARLAEQPDLSISALAEPFAVSLPAIMKHLDVLSEAGLLTRTKTGRTVTCRLKAAPMQDAITWLNRYERFWSQALSRLADFLEEKEFMSVDTIVKPSLTIKRHLKAPPAKVFAAWTDPEKVKRWMGPGELSPSSRECDMRAGGRYRCVMISPDGEDHDVSGVYREVVANEKLVFTWAWNGAPDGRTSRWLPCC